MMILYDEKNSENVLVSIFKKSNDSVTLLHCNSKKLHSMALFTGDKTTPFYNSKEQSNFPL